MMLYYLGCCALGLVTGFLVGGSASPVVQTTLPLLFALLGGGAGILGLTADPSSQRSQQRFRIAGLAAISLAGPFLFSAIYASLLRTGVGIQELIPVFSQKETPALLDAESLASLGPDESLQILLLDRNLRFAGLAPASVQSTISFIARERIGSVQFYISKRAEILNLVKELSSALKSKNHENSELMKTFLNLTSFIELAAGKEGKPSAMELDKVAEIKRNLSADDLLSETVTILKIDPTISPLVSKLVALLADAPSSTLLTDATKTDITKTVETTGKFSPAAPGPVDLFAIDSEIRPGRT